MAIISKFHRYRGQGKEANEVNVSRFGEPDHSLFIATNFWSFKQKTKIVDDEGNVAYRVQSRAISLHDKTTIKDAKGNLVAKVERKVVTLREYHRVTMADGTQFDVSHELLHLISDVANIKGLGWQLRGNIASLNFELYDIDDSVIAVIGKKLISIKDKYAIDIYRPELENEVVAVIIALQHQLRDRTNKSKPSNMILSMLPR